MENRKHTSLKDLAQALGVSIPTVSRALKDSPEISRELCAKAKKLAKEMNYRPNPFAMSLRKNAPRIIGVIVPDIVTHFFASILNGIENMAIDNGYFVIITTSHESFEHEKRNIENLVNMRVEGIIACLSQETTDFSHFAALKEINMPLILFDRVCLTDQFSSVIADGAQSAQMATQHLLDNGSKRVAFIGGANHLDIVKRRKHGYLEALRDNRIPIEKELVVCRKIDYEEGQIATETLLSLPQPPDAILAMICSYMSSGIEDGMLPARKSTSPSPSSSSFFISSSTLSLLITGPAPLISVPSIDFSFRLILETPSLI